jgi:hypothetical protein
MSPALFLPGFSTRFYCSAAVLKCSPYCREMRFGHGVAVQHAIINGWKVRKDLLHAIQVRALCTRFMRGEMFFVPKMFFSRARALSLSLALSLCLCLSVCLARLRARALSLSHTFTQPVGIPRACSQNKEKKILALGRRRISSQRIRSRTRARYELFTDQGRL